MVVQQHGTARQMVEVIVYGQVAVTKDGNRRDADTGDEEAKDQPSIDRNPAHDGRERHRCYRFRSHYRHSNGPGTGR